MIIKKEFSIDIDELLNDEEVLAEICTNRKVIQFIFKLIEEGIVVHEDGTSSWSSVVDTFRRDLVDKLDLDKVVKMDYEWLKSAYDSVMANNQRLLDEKYKQLKYIKQLEYAQKECAD